MLNAFDIATLTSAYGEGFPNAVGEGMATGLPCVTTDVGDAASIVGDIGAVVPIASPAELAAAWRWLVEMSGPARRLVGEAGRNRILARFPRKEMVSETSRQLRSVLQQFSAGTAVRELG